ncbi:MAG: hypothetical protein ABIA93_04590 [Candidatus Woesearchaeota archaeon]
MPKISIDTPLAELTLRKYEPPKGMEGRQLVRKLCLSLGVLQPGDSRDVIVDVFQVLLEHREPLPAPKIERMVMDNREKYGLQLFGVAPSNIRRQLLRLRDIFIVEKVKNEYRIREGLPLSSIFTEHLEQYYLQSIVSRVKDYLKAIDKEYNGKT